MWRRLTRAERGSFPLAGSNFFKRPAGPATLAAWRADLKLLDQMHRQLRAAIVRLSPRDRARREKGSRFSGADLVSGVTAHDLYHAGQIQLIKALKRMKAVKKS